jgi:hypothetical protein
LENLQEILPQIIPLLPKGDKGSQGDAPAKKYA